MADAKQTRVMIMAGGTGGHVFPALAVAERLCAENAVIAWMGTRKGIESEIVPKQNIDLYYLNVEGIRGRGLGVLLKTPFFLLQSIYQAFRVLSTFKPQVVLGMGGFASGPGAVAAWLKRIPVVIHEQNAVAGTTNRLSALFAKRIMQGFPNVHVRGEWCGNPVRPEIAKISSPEIRFADRKGPMRLLILGGSRGALAINTLVPEALANLPKNLVPAVLHQTGKLHAKTTQDQYVAAGFDTDADNLRIVPFIEAMDTAYEWADFVICRAGALTVAELTSAGLGALLIPFPFAIDNHQTANGQLLVDHDAAVIISQNVIDAKILSEIILAKIKSPQKRLSMALNARSLAKNLAAEHVAEICLEVANGG